MKKSFLFAAVIAVVAMVATSCDKVPNPVDFKYSVDDETLTVTFTNATKGADVYAWDFGDGQTSTEANPVHQYAEAKAYTVKLTASNKAGDASCIKEIEVGEILPPSAINLTDNSIADWDALPAEKVAKALCPEDGAYLGLKQARVYADATYIYVLVEYDPEEIPDHTSVPFHVYINVNNSDETGGYQGFPDANTDILMEGFFFAAEFDGDTPLDEGSPCDYDPTVFAWSGEVGADGWAWDELTANPFCKTQHVTGNYVELQMMRELIPTPAGVAWNEEGFTIGFDIQQAWENVGVLPLVSPTDDNSAGKAPKMLVTFDK
ncbi:MAG: PKD domain-containing protein [Paludibacteraceae bacterium]|nr:PKD domain-containing protein [Paludibacteraceae bacterium]